jgi:hypothetical protein
MHVYHWKIAFSYYSAFIFWQKILAQGWSCLVGPPYKIFLAPPLPRAGPPLASASDDRRRSTSSGLPTAWSTDKACQS